MLCVCCVSLCVCVCVCVCVVCLCVCVCVCSGDAAVGKSSLCQMFRSDGAVFQKNYTMNVGVELLEKSVSIPDTSDAVEFYIYDSAGREPFSDACENMWNQPSLMCVVFDITSEASFTSCSRWIDRVRPHCNGLQVPAATEIHSIYAQQNKTDMKKRDVTSSQSKRCRSGGAVSHTGVVRRLASFESFWMQLCTCRKSGSLSESYIGGVPCGVFNVSPPRPRVYMEISVEGSAPNAFSPTGEASRECEGSVERLEEREPRR
uniref:Small monomeric GTPase n=1 Tax=Cyprinus carpio carpio TaxID=630221 RepID=A0A9J7ZRJ1_CYPCA